MNKNKKKMPTKLIILSDSDSDSETVTKKGPVINFSLKDENLKPSSEGLSLKSSPELSTLEESNNSLSNKSRSDYCNIDLESEFKKLNCNDEHMYLNKCNKFLLKKELIERNCLANNAQENLYLYPA